MMQSSSVSLASGTRWDAIDKTMEVHPTMVSDYVRRGWVVLASYMAREDVHENAMENGYYVNKVRSEYKPVVLMGQMIVDSMREENERLQARVSQLSKCESDLAALQKKYAEAEKVFAEKSASEKRAWESAEVTRKGREEVEAQKRKMEADISKLRAALGELRMKEILGS
jgi:uncharacterized protein (DUF342 family)